MGHLRPCLQKNKIKQTSTHKGDGSAWNLNEPQCRVTDNRQQRPRDYVSTSGDSGQDRVPHTVTGGQISSFPGLWTRQENRKGLKTYWGDGSGVCVMFTYGIDLHS